MAAKKKAKKTTKKTAKVAKKTNGNGKVTRMPASFGGMVRQHRTAAGWTQPELGKMVGICAGWVGTIERGQGLPSPVLAKELMKTLRFTKDEKTAVLERFPELAMVRKKAAG